MRARRRSEAGGRPSHPNRTGSIRASPSSSTGWRELTRPELVRFLLAAGLIAILLGLLFALQHTIVIRASGQELRLGRIVALQLLPWLLWIPFLPAILWALDRYHPRDLGLPGTLAAHVPLAVAASLSHLALTGTVVWALGLTGDQTLVAHLRQIIVYRTFSDMVVYGLAALGYYALTNLGALRWTRRRVEEQADELSSQRIRLLQAQLSPHFLFNTLNGVVTQLRRRDVDGALATVTGLADLLRDLLRRTGEVETTLETELRFVENYLELQRQRVGAEIDLSIDVPDALRRSVVPHSLLVPIVENAVKHGLRERPSAHRIRVAARRANGSLRLEIEDDGPGFGASRTRGHGLGLSNTRQLLATLHHDESLLETGKSRWGGARVVVEIPLVRA